MLLCSQSNAAYENIVIPSLTRWRIVVHGGIDGFSRMPVYFLASNNNEAGTVLSAFTNAVDTYGLPSRVRADKGGENVQVAWFMLNHPQWGPGRGSFITGYCLHLHIHYHLYKVHSLLSNIIEFQILWVFVKDLQLDKK